MKNLIAIILMTYVPTLVLSQDYDFMLKGCRQGTGRGCYHYARYLYREGDQGGARKFLERACKLGHTRSCDGIEIMEIDADKPFIDPDQKKFIARMNNPMNRVNGKYKVSCNILVEKMGSCTPFECEFSHPLMKTFTTIHKIHGKQDDKCLYTQTLPNDKYIKCLFRDQETKDISSFPANWEDAEDEFMEKYLSNELLCLRYEGTIEDMESGDVKLAGKDEVMEALRAKRDKAIGFGKNLFHEMYQSCKGYTLNLEGCKPFSCQFEHPLQRGFFVTKQILGLQGPWCKTTENLPDGRNINCKFSKDDRDAISRYFDDMEKAQMATDVQELAHLPKGTTYRFNGKTVEDPFTYAIQNGFCTIGKP